ncbi:SURF1 family protein [Roseomonas sp. 573]|uniref:SURF1-like protein n=2 Tax=Roseomonas haemaphysalidis TaxID=2768162 RepID=A0ABS3KPM8_9PROT|nr:SURF1 family protein [Roseomonas haemaphysalidis]MBO1079418.1 SURF1 family protein [Roseomonas haemaphysalidis]
MALLALGTWQVERRAWKLDLIARVDARIHAPAAPAPGPADWPALTAAGDEYRHVTATGAFLPGQDTLVQATTALGGGFWVLAPFRTDGGFTVLVNRGFVPGERRDPGSRDPGLAQRRVTGLLRVTEPGGGFLRSNDPAADRWHSRDVAAIAAKRGLGEVAPYFIDAEAVPGAAPLPVGGLTVVSFPNSHLVYALTWYGLALMLAGAICYVMREEWRARRRAAARR